MLGGADTKKLFSLKMLGGAGMEKTLSSQFVRQGLARKIQEVAIKETPQTQTQKSSFDVKR